MRTTRLYINTKTIKKNISMIKEYIGNNVEIMPIIKCDGYGTHLNKLLEIIKDFKYVGVAFVDEAKLIRRIGYKGNILVLFPPDKEELIDIIKYNIFFNGCDIETLEEFNKNTNKKLTVHIEVDTGMGRTGVQIKNLDDYLKRIKKLKNIEVDGIFSHLSSSSSDLDFSQLQINKFKLVLDKIKQENINYNYAHIFNSGAIFNFKDDTFNMIRIGILIYGYYPNKKFNNIIDLESSMTLKTKINYIKELDIGDTVGYNKNFVAKRKSIIATIPFGFGDGLIGLEVGEPNNPYVIINNQNAKIIGICMDNMMIDVTDIIGVKKEMEVIIFDNKQLMVEEVASWCSGIGNYELICSLRSRIPRVFE